MPDIKTRATAEKSVKTIDKSAIAAQRMKSAYVQAKEKAERPFRGGIPGRVCGGPGFRWDERRRF